MAEAAFREAGSGPAVVCLHCSASSSGQWRPLMDRLAGRFRVIAADLYGCGRSPAWPGEREMWLDDQIELLAPVFERAGEFHLVGHSYGGAIALKSSLKLGVRVRSLVLYEPVLFALLSPESDAAREIARVRDEMMAAAPAAAAERFIDYWMGAGTWSATPAERRPMLVAAVQSVRAEWHSAFHEPTPLEALPSIDTPTLLMTGTASTAAARAVARLLARTLPRLQVEELPGAGDMAPLTDPERVNALIERFLLQA
jgi:pimeloyl-ACP methyl ester carboxylesterase